MEKEINIAEILKDKPKGTKLYSPIFGKCKLSKVESDTCIRVHTDNNHYYFNKYGHYTTNAMNSIYGECCLFPSKEMHDWSKFAWKKGDVLVSNDDTRECIFDGITTTILNLMQSIGWIAGIRIASSICSRTNL